MHSCNVLFEIVQTWPYLFLVLTIFAYTPVRSVVEIYLVNTLLVSIQIVRCGKSLGSPFAFGYVAREWLFMLKLMLPVWNSALSVLIEPKPTHLYSELHLNVSSHPA